MDPDEFKKTIPLYTDEELKIIEKRGDFFAKNTELSVLGEFLKGNLGTSGVFAGHPFTQWMCVVMLEPDYAVSLVEAYAERTIENFKLYRQAVGNNIDTIFVSSTDFGTQNAEFYRPDVFKEIYFPSYKKINDYIHGNSEYKIIFHSCGSIRNILPYFVEAGVDILNPVQISAAGMDAGELKKEFGDKIIFWGGGIDTQHIYPDGTAEEVRAHVKERIEILGKDGGFVFTPIHNTQYGVPPENIEAMIETVLKYGRYDSGRGEK
ncbi:uroporphyrinogen decarboxylase family protein [Clostridium sp. MCC353]|uniref:uroporphyrinogen decarboxylase family protein n=1 Tax=Clostridium sp. MCC353 TaxID=2592646 RepID=UPI001C00D8E9|nr:uroporphyrinogen decarboxylase family protein [Clostridium sp. MCC353]